MLNRATRLLNQARCFSINKNFKPDPLLLDQGIFARKIYRNISVPEYYEMACSHDPTNPFTIKNFISDQGALCSYSAFSTGRTPKAKRVVQDYESLGKVWWGDINIPITQLGWELNLQRCIDYFNNKPYLYVVDGYLGWDPKYRMKIRVICARAYHALFMRNMLIRPTKEQLAQDFEKVDFTIFNAGEFYADPHVPGVDSQTSINLNLTTKQMAILGSQYGGEMKKGMFSVAHYAMPDLGVVSLHASANEGAQGDTTLLFGLSGTGKTTLSADPHRKLIGDDEHCWSDEGIFNLEGGCYAKCINLSREKEPEIFDAIRFGSILENIEFYHGTRQVNYDDSSITENTRCSYPLEYIPSAKLPAVGGHPKNVIFLTCDAYGVLPPVSKLTPEQTMYHFISGYTAKVAGTEIGIKEPQPTFSACFGEAFLTRHPSLYAEMLAQKLKKHKTRTWLINTGWTGGKYGVGHRMDLKSTRAIIDAIHNGELEQQETETLPVFNLQVPKHCQGVDESILIPKNTWEDKNDYDLNLRKLAEAFINNFKKYESGSSSKIKKAGPSLD